MLGTALVDVFSDWDVIAWDRLDCDITNTKELEAKMSAIGANVVINAAADTDVEKAEQEPERSMRVNGEAPGIIANQCARLGIPMVQMSTSWVFDGTKGKPYVETDTPRPVCAYARSKWVGEQNVMDKLNNYYIIRTDRLYGRAGNNVIHKFLWHAKQESRLRAVQDQIGSSAWVDDLAHAMRQLLEDHAPFGIYHLANEGSASWYDLAVEALKDAHIATPVVPVSGAEFPRLATVPQNSSLANTKRPLLRHWKEALKAYLE